MKTRKLWLVIPTVLATMVAMTGVVRSQTVQVSPGSKPDPQVINGTSGGTTSSDCGNISSAPNQVIKVTEAMPYLRVDVKSAGSPTLLIDGPTGRFCVLGDGSGKGPQMAGFWAAGSYSVNVGDRNQGRNPYTLTISQSQK